MARRLPVFRPHPAHVPPRHAIDRLIHAKPYVEEILLCPPTAFHHDFEGCQTKSARRSVLWSLQQPPIPGWAIQDEADAEADHRTLAKTKNPRISRDVTGLRLSCPTILSSRGKGGCHGLFSAIGLFTTQQVPQICFVLRVWLLVFYSWRASCNIGRRLVRQARYDASSALVRHRPGVRVPRNFWTERRSHLCNA